MRTKAVYYAARGRLGNVTHYTRRGRVISRVIPERVFNPNTEEQQSIRARFSALSAMAAAFVDACNLGFKKSMKGLQSTRNVFQSLNWPALSTDPGGMIEVRFAKLVVSKGSLPMVTFGNADFSEPETVVVPFQGNTDQPRTDPNDKVYLFVYQPDLNQGILSSATPRSQGTARVTVPASWQGMQVHAYGFTVGKGPKTKGMASDTSYVGSGTIA